VFAIAIWNEGDCWQAPLGMVWDDEVEGMSGPTINRTFYQTSKEQ
jgi:hypothetical protein